MRHGLLNVLAVCLGVIIGFLVTEYLICPHDKPSTPRLGTVVHDTVYVDRSCLPCQYRLRDLASELYATNFQRDIARDYIAMTFGDERAKQIMAKARQLGWQQAKHDTTSWIAYTTW
jgi:hypothetical protein